jgi:diadenosine tetraphosphate (Ap4A) HIT family hydrolase
MAEIYQTRNFIVESAEKPHITRTDGGHIKIVPKIRITDRTQLTAKQAIEFMRLTMVVGEAMTKGLQQQGIDIGRINYQDMGNWSVFSPEGPYFHLHLYGRAKDAKIQKYGDAVHLPQRETGFYDKFEPLNNEDIIQIKKQIELILKEKKYQDDKWGLV